MYAHLRHVDRIQYVKKLTEYHHVHVKKVIKVNLRIANLNVQIMKIAGHTYLVYEWNVLILVKEFVV